MMQMNYRPMMRMPAQNTMMIQPGMDVGFDGKMLRKAMARKTVDHHSSVVKYLEVFVCLSNMSNMRWTPF